jgi:hypothetical protein
VALLFGYVWGWGSARVGEGQEHPLKWLYARGDGFAWVLVVVGHEAVIEAGGLLCPVPHQCR